MIARGRLFDEVAALPGLGGHGAVDSSGAGAAACGSRDRSRCSGKGPPGRLAGPVSAAVESTQFRPLRDCRPVVRRQLRSGRLQDLHAVYGGSGIRFGW